LFTLVERQKKTIFQQAAFRARLLKAENVITA